MKTLSSFLPHIKCEFKSESTKITLSSVFNVLPCNVFTLHCWIIYLSISEDILIMSFLCLSTFYFNHEHLFRGTL